MMTHQALALHEALPGMRLAVDVVDTSGQILLPAGAELSEALIRSLGRREIEGVIVEREPDPVASQVARERVERQLVQLFRHAGQGFETNELRQAVLAFRLERGK